MTEAGALVGAEDNSDAEEAIVDLGAGSGAGDVKVAKEALSRGRAPLDDGKVRLLLLVNCSDVFRLIIGLGKSEATAAEEKAGGDFFCFSRLSAIASTSAKVLSN